MAREREVLNSNIWDAPKPLHQYIGRFLNCQKNTYHRSTISWVWNEEFCKNHGIVAKQGRLKKNVPLFLFKVCINHSYSRYRILKCICFATFISCSNLNKMKKTISLVFSKTCQRVIAHQVSLNHWNKLNLPPMFIWFFT